MTTLRTFVSTAAMVAYLNIVGAFAAAMAGLLLLSGSAAAYDEVICNILDIAEAYEMISRYMPNAIFSENQVIIGDHVVLDADFVPGICVSAQSGEPGDLEFGIMAVGQSEIYNFIVWRLGLSASKDMMGHRSLENKYWDEEIFFIPIESSRTVVIRHAKEK